MIIGCDPGLSGALAFYDGRELRLVDMPTRTAIVNRKDRRVLNEQGVIGALQTFQIMGAEMLVIEQVNGMPGQSGPAAFTFGYGVGVVTAAALAIGLKVEKVASATWKAATVGSSQTTKHHSIRMAVQTFPESAGLFQRKKDDGRAEASLIAWWGFQTRGRFE